MKTKQFSLAFILLFIFFAGCGSGKEKQQSGEKSSHTEETMGTALYNEQANREAVAGEARYKSFTLDGLKYQTTIELMLLPDNRVVGYISSDEYGLSFYDGKFSGHTEGNTLHVQFAGEPPVVGARSEWTDKSWKLVRHEGAEHLSVPFHAYNYETEEWSDTEYFFGPVEDEGVTQVSLGICESVFENDDYRVEICDLQGSEGFLRTGGVTYTYVIPKKSGKEPHLIIVADRFEAAAGDLLLLSEGSDGVKSLYLYSLQSGMCATRVKFVGNITPDAEGRYLHLYIVPEEGESIVWNEEMHSWERFRGIKPGLPYPTNAPEAFGYCVAVQKAHINIATKEINYSDEYEWRETQ